MASRVDRCTRRHMVRPIAVLFCLVSSLALAEVSVESPPLYSFHLDGDWTVRCAIREENQYCLISKVNDAQLTISGVDFKVRPGTLDKLAKATMRFVLNNEANNHSQGRGTIERNWTSPIPGGIQLNYEGHDETGRFFRYAGLLFEYKLVNVYLEMPTRSASNSASVFESVLQRIRY